MNRFDGKVVLVTGAGSGIGAATAARLHEEGASVVAGDLNAEGLSQLADRLQDRCVTVNLDVTDNVQVQEFVLTAEQRFGGLDGLVNCAGVRCVGTVLDTDYEDWRRAMAVNVDGTFLTCQAFSREMVRRGAPGAIVNMSSAAGLRATPNRIGYVAGKFAVVGISQTMGLELAPYGIRVNVIAPGMIRTAMTSSMFADPANVERIVASMPIGRYGEPEEVAAAVAFLLSDDASLMTASVVAVDGGQIAGIASH